MPATDTLEEATRLLTIFVQNRAEFQKEFENPRDFEMFSRYVCSVIARAMFRNQETEWSIYRY